MLILTRKRGEAVDLFDRNSDKLLATVVVLEILSGGAVRLGFDAGQEIHIVRDNARRRDDGQGNETESEESGDE